MSSSCGMAAALALCVLAATGCGLGPGDETGVVELTVTRDYGRQLMLSGEEESTESDTVLRILDREAEVETSFGGGFVQSINGVSGGTNDGRRHDWFFYVNGIESPVGAAGYELQGGDRIWWDHRDWTAAMRVPAVVGSYPEPFVGGFEGERWPARVECAGERPVCDLIEMRIREAGAEPRSSALAGPSGQVIRVLVGPYGALRGDPTAELLEEPPSRSGVFASFGDGPAGRWLLTLLDVEGETDRQLISAGLVAALRGGGGAPTWVVTGTDDVGVRQAADALDAKSLRDRYAVVVTGGSQVDEAPAPAAGDAGGGG